MRFSPGCSCCGPPPGYIETPCCPNYIPETLWMTVSNAGAVNQPFKACATAASFSATATYENPPEFGSPGNGNVFRFAPLSTACGAVTRYFVIADSGSVCWRQNGLNPLGSNWYNPEPGGAVGNFNTSLTVVSCDPFELSVTVVGSLDGITYGTMTITE